MSRHERQNMVEYIEKMKGMSPKDMMYMTDAEIEYIYETVYFQEEITE